MLQAWDQFGNSRRPDGRQTLLKWKAKSGVLDMSDARELRALESENAKLKEHFSEQMLDDAILKDVAPRKW